MLKQQEVMALEMIFQDNSKLSRAIKEGIKNAESDKWEDTGVGFYSIIKFKIPLNNIPELRMWSYSFEHPDFSHGGVYNCMILSEEELELEAVTLGGGNWPNPTDSSLFREQR